MPRELQVKPIEPVEPLDSDCVLGETLALVPPGQHAPLLRCAIERYNHPALGERWALSLSYENPDRADSLRPLCTEVIVRSHGYHQAGSFDDRTCRDPETHFFFPEGSLLAEAARAGTLDQLPWTAKDHELLCEMHSGRSTWAHDRDVVATVTEQLTLTRTSGFIAGWSGRYSFERYVDTSP